MALVALSASKRFRPDGGDGTGRRPVERRPSAPADSSEVRVDARGHGAHRGLAGAESGSIRIVVVPRSRAIASRSDHETTSGIARIQFRIETKQKVRERNTIQMAALPALGRRQETIENAYEENCRSENQKGNSEPVVGCDETRIRDGEIVEAERGCSRNRYCDGDVFPKIPAAVLRSKPTKTTMGIPYGSECHQRQDQEERQTTQFPSGRRLEPVPEHREWHERSRCGRDAVEDHRVDRSKLRTAIVATETVTCSQLKTFRRGTPNNGSLHGPSNRKIAPIAARITSPEGSVGLGNREPCDDPNQNSENGASIFIELDSQPREFQLDSNPVAALIAEQFRSRSPRLTRAGDRQVDERRRLGFFVGFKRETCSDPSFLLESHQFEDRTVSPRGLEPRTVGLKVLCSTN
jgi:hypothetical protein